MTTPLRSMPETCQVRRVVSDMVHFLSRYENRVRRICHDCSALRLRVGVIVRVSDGLIPDPAIAGIYHSKVDVGPNSANNVYAVLLRRNSVPNFVTNTMWIGPRTSTDHVLYSHSRIQLSWPKPLQKWLFIRGPRMRSATACAAAPAAPRAPGPTSGWSRRRP